LFEIQIFKSIKAVANENKTNLTISDEREESIGQRTAGRRKIRFPSMADFKNYNDTLRACHCGGTSIVATKEHPHPIVFPNQPSPRTQCLVSTPLLHSLWSLFSPRCL
jgi:hypothetical protein